ncbi:hypothetical protein PGT21_015690 [Puccinia graminis f. sp. tritici]|uniref:MULE transposase domain-containing protein n=1 Tax=Puccinia graminis f. sp. tritici TaxID=56615 RepID=A0A5B0LQU1_PUCGR|nr:hypothetical protein PGT21_015690 [Puccinia graminis f. sp. tritici]KAA1130540.1 hypothetical protein PGTUg99_018881 [Puccinia graminis f. sp. tritici]
MFRKLGGPAPAFETNPHQFSIPGQSLAEAEEFVQAMQATVMWLRQNKFDNSDLVSSSTSSKTGRPLEYVFKLDYICPWRGHHVPPVNSCKQKPSQKCGCPAQFSIQHHIKSNSLRVSWSWDHNHDPYSKEDMQICQSPKVVNNWLVERIVSGLGWKAIKQLTRSPDLEMLKSALILPEGHHITYDWVRYLIHTRVKVRAKRDPDVFKSLALWNSELLKAGWHTFAPVITDSPNFIFALQSPWQRQMMKSHGQGIILLDSTHNSVKNHFLSDGRKISLYTIMIRDPIVGKGLPVCWAFTASEST